MMRLTALVLLLASMIVYADDKLYKEYNKLIKGYEVTDNFYQGVPENEVVSTTMPAEGYTYSATGSVMSRVKYYERDFRNNFSRRTFTALENVLHFTYVVLNKRGQSKLASLIKKEWHYEYKQQFERTLDGVRYIGEFKPLSQWLSDRYEQIEKVLGKDLCDLLHISDIKTFNYCIPVVFDPCYSLYEKGDFIDHFATDNNYHGLAPVVLYWVSYGTCAGFTFGMGFFAFCSPIASALELLFENTVADNLGGWLYDRICGSMVSERVRDR